MIYLKKTGFDNKIKIAFDEWNLKNWHHPGHGQHRKGQNVDARDGNDVNSLYTMADALFSACFLNSCLRNSKYVEMANMAPVVNTRGPLFVHPLGIVKRTTYHVMKLYTTKLQPNVLPVSITSDELSKDGKSVPVVDAVVTCSNDKKQLAIALVNKDPEKEILCNLGMGNLNESITATILSGDSTESFNDIENPDRVVPQKIKVKIKNGKLMVPAHSLVILEINR